MLSFDIDQRTEKSNFGIKKKKKKTLISISLKFFIF